MIAAKGVPQLELVAQILSVALTRVIVTMMGSALEHWFVGATIVVHITHLPGLVPPYWTVAYCLRGYQVPRSTVYNKLKIYLSCVHLLYEIV